MTKTRTRHLLADKRARVRTRLRGPSWTQDELEVMHELRESAKLSVRLRRRQATPRPRYNSFDQRQISALEVALAISDDPDLSAVQRRSIAVDVSNLVIDELDAYEDFARGPGQATP